MNDEKQKYANGDSLDASKMSKEEKLKAIEYWCEGNKELKNFLLYLNEKNIETIGCCSGHDIGAEHSEAQSAYIAIKLGNKVDNLLLDLLALSEEENFNMKIGFIRGRCDNEKRFCVLNSNVDGYNESFFKNLNEQCKKLIEKEHIDNIYRKKYEMLRTILIDDRSKREDRGTQYIFDIGDENIQAIGFFKYGNRRVNIPNDEIIRLGQSFLSNPGSNLPKDFYSAKITTVEQSVNILKEIANKSRLPLNLIKQTFEKMKNSIISTKNINMQLEEGGR